MSATVAGASGFCSSSMVSRMYFAWVTMPISRRSLFSSTCWVSSPAMKPGAGALSETGVRPVGFCWRLMNTGPPELPGKTEKSSRKVGKSLVGVSG